MKLNISYPVTGCNKLIEIEDERKLRAFYDKRISREVEGDSLGDEWKGYVFKITGGNDKQGFPMKQGILTTGRVRLLLSKGQSCYRPRRDGERRRKSVRGCIVDANLSVLSLAIKKKGENEIEGLTDKTIPRRLGPKRASKIRKLFNLTKEDDVRQYVIRTPAKVKEGKKPHSKAPKIQRLITPLMLQHKRRRLALKRQRIEKKREEAQQYARILAIRAKEQLERKESLSRKRRSLRESQSSLGDEVITAVSKKAKKAAIKKAVAKSKTTRRYKGDKYRGMDPAEWYAQAAQRKAYRQKQEARAAKKAAVATKEKTPEKPAAKAKAVEKKAPVEKKKAAAGGDKKAAAGGDKKAAAGGDKKAGGAKKATAKK